MHLVVSRNPILILALIVAMLFPMMIVEGAVVSGHHSHGDPAAPAGQTAGAQAQDSQETAVDSGAVADTSDGEACHHVSADGACTMHCSSSSCTTLYVNFAAQLAILPELFKGPARLLSFPDPLPHSIHRPPLASA